MKKLLLIAYSLAMVCLISTTATANPVLKETSQVHDVGWCPGSDIITYFEILQPACPVSVFTDQEHFAFEQLRTIPEDHVCVSISHYGDMPKTTYLYNDATCVALLPARYQYQRMRFKSFNKKINKAHIQRYGQDPDRERTIALINYSPGTLSYDEYKKEMYQLWESRVKLDG